MIAKELLVQCLEYSLWASLEVLAAAEKLPAEALILDRKASFGGILETLVHIFQADRAWILRLEGNPHARLKRIGETITLATLKADWPLEMGRLIAWVRSQADHRFEESVYWRNIRGEEKIEKIYKVLLHAVNHASYHRGQVVTMIKQAGGHVVSTDLVYYDRM